VRVPEICLNRQPGMDAEREGNRRQTRARCAESEADHPCRRAGARAILPACIGWTSTRPAGRAAAGSLPTAANCAPPQSASLADGQTGLRDYMRRYPYACLEQKSLQGVATQNRAAWDDLAANLPTYLADNGLANFFPGDGRGSVALTAYVLAIADQAGWSLPLDAQNLACNKA
jgi:hypothetical protein